MLRKIKMHAFTLLECLVALLVISGAVLVYNGLTANLASNIRYMSDNQAGNWLLFAQQLQIEWSNCQFDRIEGHKIYLKKGGQELAYGLSKSDDFRKTAANGKGYQPMLFGLKNCQMSEQKGLVTMTFHFKTGLERTFTYDFQSKT